MLSIDLKTSLHQMIDHENNEEVLYQIKEILEQKNIPVDELSGLTINEFNKEIDEAEAAIDSGEFSTHEDVKTRFEQVFRK